MSPSNYHSVLVKVLRDREGMTDLEIEKFFNRMEVIEQSQKFISGSQRLPVKCMKLAVGFVDKYACEYPHAKFRDLGRNRYELEYFRYEDSVRVGLGLAIKHNETSMYQMINVNGVEALTGNQSFFL